MEILASRKYMVSNLSSFLKGSDPTKLITKQSNFETGNGPAARSSERNAKGYDVSV